MSSGDALFLDVNGIGIDHSSDDLYALTMRVPEGGVDKPTIASELERIAKSR